MSPARYVITAGAAVAAFNLTVAALDAFVLPPPTFRWLIVFAQAATGFWAVIAVIATALYAIIDRELRTSRAQNLALREAAPAHVVCAWCEFTADPVGVLMHEGDEHGA